MLNQIKPNCVTGPLKKSNLVFHLSQKHHVISSVAFEYISEIVKKIKKDKKMGG